MWSARGLSGRWWFCAMWRRKRKRREREKYAKSLACCGRELCGGWDYFCGTRGSTGAQRDGAAGAEAAQQSAGGKGGQYCCAYRGAGEGVPGRCGETVVGIGCEAVAGFVGAGEFHHV